jgi:hypothetical protein
MDTINKSIVELRTRLGQLQLQKIELEANNKKNDCDKNLQIIKNAYEKRTQKVKENHYSKNCIVAKFIDKDMVEPLEAIYDILININDRLTELENSK